MYLTLKFSDIFPTALSFKSAVASSDMFDLDFDSTGFADLVWKIINQTYDDEFLVYEDITKAEYRLMETFFTESPKMQKIWLMVKEKLKSYYSETNFKNLEEVVVSSAHESNIDDITSKNVDSTTDTDSTSNSTSDITKSGSNITAISSATDVASVKDITSNKDTTKETNTADFITQADTPTIKGVDSSFVDTYANMQRKGDNAVNESIDDDIVSNETSTDTTNVLSSEETTISDISTGSETATHNTDIANNVKEDIDKDVITASYDDSINIKMGSVAVLFDIYKQIPADLYRQIITPYAKHFQVLYS
jgi:hypothetical protein